MPGTGTAEGVMIRAGLNSFAFNWQDDDDDADLKTQLEGLLQECNDQYNLDPSLAEIYANGTDAQRRTLAAAEEWKAASLALYRPEIFKILGEHARLAMEDSDSFDNKIALLSARALELIDDLLGSVPSAETAHGRVSHGFKDSMGNLLYPQIGLETKW